MQTVHVTAYRAAVCKQSYLLFGDQRVMFEALYILT
jgi:hypothetical protein